MEPINNNQFEVIPNAKSKRKSPSSCTNVFLNPALDLLANEDPICNTKMEVIPNKKRKRTRSCDTASFENTALDVGISKAAINEFLTRELDNVRKNLRNNTSAIKVTYSHENLNSKDSDPIYANMNSSDPCLALPRDSTHFSQFRDSPVTQELGIPTNSMNMSIDLDSTMNNTLPTNQLLSEISAIEPVKKMPQTINQIFVNNQTNLNLSFIDRLTMDSTNQSNQSLYLDDDLNESNIMEIKTITIITKMKRFIDKKKSTNPFLNGSLDDDDVPVTENPFLYDTAKPVDYEPCGNDATQVLQSELVPRRLFDTNSTISTVNEGNYSLPSENIYENIDNLTGSPIYENINDMTEGNYNKQSKILGHDVSHFNATDILNLNKLSASNDSNDSKKDFAHKFLKAGKLSKKVFKKIKQSFKHDKVDNNTTLNPYEVPRKQPKAIPMAVESGIENPGLKLDISDEIIMEELDDEEHQYETVKTLRNTHLNTNITPLKERINDNYDAAQKIVTPGKKTVRFDSTLNQEKVITGDSFDCEQSPGFDVKIDRYHDELENCINEKKFLRQNM